ncbi:MAG: FCSD flavin-binding domain-containing protein [Sutterella wadsworthensis]
MRSSRSSPAARSPSPSGPTPATALAGEDYGLFVADVFRIMDGKIGRTNTRARYQYLKAQPAEQALAAQYLHSWMNTITADSFG